MADLPFNQDFIDWLRDNRTDSLDSFFNFFTFLGSEMGYILIVLGLYWLFNKNFALRLTMVIIVTSALNQLIKVIVRNPRPYVSEGTYEENWAISESDIEETKDSYSTPSGHAMGAASFWAFIYNRFKSRQTLIFTIIMIGLIGFSRPYLGVHFLEDVILGWILGLTVVYMMLRYEPQFNERWGKLSKQTGSVVIFTVAFLVMFISGLMADFGADGVIYATLAGMISGLIIGYNIEITQVGFIAETKSIVNGILRYLVGIVLSLGVLTGLDILFEQIADDETELGYILRFIRYASLGLVATVITGKIFLTTGLADSNLSSAKSDT